MHDRNKIVFFGSVTDSFNVQFLVGHEAHEAGTSLLAMSKHIRQKIREGERNPIFIFAVFKRDEVESVFESLEPSSLTTRVRYLGSFLVPL